MKIGENLSLILLLVITTQISLKDGKPTDIHSMNLGNFTRVKRNLLQNAFLPTRRHKSQKGNNIMLGKYSPLEKSIYKVYNFPDVEYPFVDFHKMPFYREENINIFEIDKISPSVINNKALSDFKKQKRMNRKLQKLRSDQNYHLKRETPSLTKQSNPFEYLWLKKIDEFPEVQYPINAMETWVPNYWNPSLYTNIENREPSYLPPPERRRKSRKKNQFYKQLSEASQIKEGKEKINDKITTREIHYTQNNNNYENGKASDSFKQEIVHFDEKTQGTSLNTLMAPDMLFVTPIPYKVLTENSTYKNIDKNYNKKAGNNNVMNKEMKLNAETPTETHTKTDKGPWNVKIPIPCAETDDDMTTNYTVAKENNGSTGRSIIIVPINIKIIAEIPKNILTADDIMKDDRLTDNNNKEVTTNFIKKPTVNSNNDEQLLQLLTREDIPFLTVTSQQPIKSIELATDILINEDFQKNFTDSDTSNLIMTLEHLDQRDVGNSQVQQISPVKNISKNLDINIRKNALDTFLKNLTNEMEDYATNKTTDVLQLFLNKLTIKSSHNITRNMIKENHQTDDYEAYDIIPDNQNTDSFSNSPSSPILLPGQVLYKNSIPLEMASLPHEEKLSNITKYSLISANSKTILPVDDSISTTLLKQDTRHQGILQDKCKKSANEDHFYNTNEYVKKVPIAYVDRNSLSLTQKDHNSHSLVSKVTQCDKQKQTFIANENVQSNNWADISNAITLSNLTLPVHALNQTSQFDGSKDKDVQNNNVQDISRDNVLPDFWNLVALLHKSAKSVERRNKTSTINKVPENVPDEKFNPNDSLYTDILLSQYEDLSLTKNSSQINEPDLLTLKNESILEHEVIHFTDNNNIQNQTKDKEIRDVSLADKTVLLDIMSPNIKETTAIPQNDVLTELKKEFSDYLQANIEEDNMRFLLKYLTTLKKLKKSTKQVPTDNELVNLSSTKKLPISTNRPLQQMEVLSQVLQKDNFKEIADTDFTNTTPLVLEFRLPYSHDETHSDHGAIYVPTTYMQKKNYAGRNKNYLQLLLNNFLSNNSKACDEAHLKVPINVTQFRNAPQRNSPIGIKYALQLFLKKFPKNTSLAIDTIDAMQRGNASEENFNSDNYQISEEQLDLILNELENEKSLLVNNTELQLGPTNVITDNPVNEGGRHILSEVDNNYSTLSIKSLPSVLPLSDDPANIQMQQTSPSKSGSENFNIIKYTLQNFLNEFSNESIDAVNNINPTTKVKDNNLRVNIITNALKLYLNKLSMKSDNIVSQIMGIDTIDIKEHPKTYKIHKINPEHKIDSKNGSSPSITLLENDIITKNLTSMAIPIPQQKQIDETTEYVLKDKFDFQNISATNDSKNSVPIIQGSLHQDIPDMISNSVPLTQISTPGKHEKRPWDVLKRNLQGYLNILEDKYINAVDERPSSRRINEIKPINTIEKYAIRKNCTLKTCSDDHVLKSPKSTVPSLENMSKESFPVLANDIAPINDVDEVCSSLTMDESCNIKIKDTQRDNKKHTFIPNENVQSNNWASNIIKDVLLRNWPLTAYTTSNHTQTANLSNKDIIMNEDVQAIPIAYMLPDNFWTLVGLRQNCVTSVDRKNLTSTINNMVPEYGNEFKPNDNLYSDSTLLPKDLNLTKNSLHKYNNITEDSVLEHKVGELTDNTQDNQTDAESTNILFTEVNGIILPSLNNTVSSNNKTITETAHSYARLLKKDFLDNLLTEIGEDNMKFFLKYFVKLNHNNTLIKRIPGDISLSNTTELNEQFSTSEHLNKDQLSGNNTPMNISEFIIPEIA